MLDKLLAEPLRIVGPVSSAEIAIPSISSSGVRAARHGEVRVRGQLAAQALAEARARLARGLELRPRGAHGEARGLHLRGSGGTVRKGGQETLEVSGCS